MNVFFSLLPTVVLTVYGQVVTKWRVGHFAERTAGMPLLDRLFVYIFDPFIISAYVFTFAASLAWMIVVEKYPLSLVYPLYIGTTILIVTALGILLFREPFSIPRIISIALIISGIVIGLRN
jgi:multidrug transporter EmrE-like cation transporter